jgi:hypothetical protein
MGIIRLPSDDGSYKTWTEYMQIYECSFELSAVEYAGWCIENGVITPGSLNPYALNLTGPGPMVEFTVLDSTFSYNKTFHIYFFGHSKPVQYSGKPVRTSCY